MRSNPKTVKHSKPRTPMRRFFTLDFQQPSIAFGKLKCHQHESDTTPPHRAPPRNPGPSADIKVKPTNVNAPLPHRPARIALQNHDTSLDAVVISTLQTPPFCCHEDLLTMPRSRLITTARALNARLPALLQIDLPPAGSESGSRESLPSQTLPDDFPTDSYIRACVEAVVGIRPQVPPAPKGIKRKATLKRAAASHTTAANKGKDGSRKRSLSPPSSPLANRLSKFQTTYVGGIPEMGSRIRVKVMGRLQEEEEGDDGESTDVSVSTRPPPMKRRKIHRLISPMGSDDDVNMIYGGNTSTVHSGSALPLELDKVTTPAKVTLSARNRLARLESFSSEYRAEEDTKVVNTAFVSRRSRHRSSSFHHQVTIHGSDLNIPPLKGLAGTMKMDSNSMTGRRNSIDGEYSLDASVMDVDIGV